jgi:plasmid replication initiation protein
MSNELVPVNTPETLGVTPRYALQHNAINRSAHTLSATASKLTALVMSLLPSDMSSLTATFTFTDFCKALGYTKSGESYKIFKEAVNECMKCVITIETEPDEKGKKEWKQFTWFSMATFSEKTGQATMEFSDKLAAFLSALKWVYAKIDLHNIGALQSRYAIHLYEFLFSYAFLKGKSGNHSNEWYVRLDLSDLRFLMGTPKDAYKETHLFKQRVIEGPIKEINKAGIGLEITINGVKQGRCLVAIRFDCKQVPKLLPVTKGRGKKTADETLPIPEPNPKTADEREEKELEHLKELYPDEYAELYTAEMAKSTPAFLTEGFKQMIAAAAAKTELKRRHGTVK